MKKIVLIITLVIISAAGQLHSQTVGRTMGAKLLDVTPEEKMFVHFNSSLLFPGEYLYYKAYVVEAATHTRSELSKVAYLELVGEDGKMVFRHLLPLENGLGYGDFFIPTDLPSGSYKLLGYTNWMRNQRNFFKADLVVINPYRGDQTALTPSTEVFDTLNPFLSQKRTATGKTGNSTKPPFRLETDKPVFGTREKVRLDFLENSSSPITGNYSLSVRKIDSIRTPGKPDPLTFSREAVGSQLPGDIYLPEFRGSLISGSIAPTASAAGISLGNVKIAFSVPGEELLYKVATTDEKGTFQLGFDEPRTAPELLVQIIGKDRNYFRLHLNEHPAVDYSDLRFAEFYITPEMEQWILDRSVQNQVENAYYHQKPDTIVLNRSNAPFYVKTPELYPLDAFNRFPTIKETFVEIIGSSWIGKNREGEESIIVREPNGGQNYGLPALLLVDGVMVQDHSSFISYPAKRVKSIGILRDNYYIGSHIFEGIVDVRTIDGNFWMEHAQDYLYHTELQVPEPQKLYFQQTYSEGAGNSPDPLPDLRTQLLWKPEITLAPGEETVFEFYTSDVPGTYLAEVEGFSAQGTPVSLSRYFQVTDPVF